MRVESHGETILTEKTNELVEKPASVPLCPQQIPYGLTLVANQSLCRGRLVTAHMSHGMVMFLCLIMPFFKCIGYVLPSDRTIMNKE
jgi:hypothetical protein